MATGLYQATWGCQAQVRSRQVHIRIAMGRDQKATGGCEERDWAVRSGRTIATERIVAIR
ncbi:hypothetical protein Taro_007732 [Colocasia esculenta]|uniref:Uncharacterized protein n=1 Tax=Colocasia esculenta TaxID=4460 RepID=A0A843TV19_COLES|nr:hypothetical protein [Colocasia esculenta]